MKRITAEEFYSLIESVKNEKQRGAYWDIKIVEEMETDSVIDEAAFDNSSFAGYGPGSIPMRTIQVAVKVDKSVVNVAKLLKAKGYLPKIFPINASGNLFNTNGCTDQFEEQSFTEELLTDLVWCLKNNKIESDRFDGILNSLTFEDLMVLHQSDIPADKKDKIYRFNSECDPKRNLCEQVDSLFSSAYSTQPLPKRLFDCKDAYDGIETFLEKNQEQLDIDFDLYVKKLQQERTNLAKEARDNKQYDLAEIIYTQLMDNSTTPESKSIYYLELAIVNYQAKNYNSVIEHLESYKSTHKKKFDLQYWGYRALTRVKQNQLKHAAVNLVSLAKGDDKQKVQLWRIHIFKDLPEESFIELCDKLLELAQNESEKNHASYQAEYLAYIQLAAEQDCSIAQCRLYEAWKESDSFLAEMWLERAATQGCLPAQHLMAQYYKNKYLSTGEKGIKNYQLMRAFIKQSADSNYSPSKSVMHDYYQALAESYQSAEPKNTPTQKRKAFCEAVEQHAPAQTEPPLKLQRDDSSDFDLYLDSHKPGKRVRIPDTTPAMAQQVKEAYQQDKSKKKRNYLAANLSLIFSDAAKPEERTRRYMRTVAITGRDNQTSINIDDLYPTSNAQESERLTEYLRNKHKNVIDRSQSVYNEAKQQRLPEIKQLQFIPDTHGKNHNPHTYKHNEYALYEYLCKKQNLQLIIDKFIRENSDILKPGCKIYGVVLDIFTINASCTDCKKTMFMIQNDRGFLKTLEEVLTAKNFQCLNKRRPGLNGIFGHEGNRLYMQVRIRAQKQLNNKTDPLADISVIPQRKGLKALNNVCFFHKIEDVASDQQTSDKKYLIFESGTNATRPQATST